MKLTKITIKDFKKIKRVDLELADLNILVGANASGKSSILQSIHLASCLMRQAKGIRADKSSTVDVSDLDYIPTDDYIKLGNSGDWGNQHTATSSTVDFEFESDDNETINAYANIKAARNAGISVSGSLGAASILFRQKSGPSSVFFSAYSPGISGISNEEEKRSKRVVLKACSFGDGNSYLRNALHLLNEGEKGEESEINQIQDWLKELIGKIDLKLKYDEEKDLKIEALANVGEKDIPLELLGMGYLQLIQIFCYALLFNPKILLIDEPDIHLHPDVQEKLLRVLSKIAKDKGLRIILTTHSPFIVRGAPTDAKVYWMKDGAIQKDTNRNAVELALGWGALSKKIILFSEDQNTQWLKHIIAQWPEIERTVAIHPGNGYKNLPQPKEAASLKNTFGEQFQIVIHRDRDSMTNDEVEKLEKKYGAEGIPLWITDYADIESYFCEVPFLTKILNLEKEKVKDILNPIIEKLNKLDNAQFSGQRNAINKELYGGDGGSPSKDKVYEELKSQPLGVATGKNVLVQLVAITGNKLKETNLLEHSLDGQVAVSLKKFLEKISRGKSQKP